MNPRKGFVTVGTSTGAYQVFVVGDSTAEPPRQVVWNCWIRPSGFVRTLEE
jgi:hypothetical protein